MVSYLVIRFHLYFFIQSSFFSFQSFPTQNICERILLTKNKESSDNKNISVEALKKRSGKDKWEAIKTNFLSMKIFFCSFFLTLHSRVQCLYSKPEQNMDFVQWCVRARWRQKDTFLICSHWKISWIFWVQK